MLFEKARLSEPGICGSSVVVNRKRQVAYTLVNTLTEAVKLTKLVYGVSIGQLPTN